MILSEKEREELKKVIEPVMKYLSNTKKFHPHIKIIIDSTTAEMVEGVAGFGKEKFIKED